jgi:hypothetical protein
MRNAYKFVIAMRLLRSKTSLGEMQRVDIVLQTNGQLPGRNSRRDVLKHLSAHARLRRNCVFAQRTNQRFASLGSDFLILILHELPEFDGRQLEFPAGDN